jgi:hypothetical protein
MKIFWATTNLMGFFLNMLLFYNSIVDHKGLINIYIPIFLGAYCLAISIMNFIDYAKGE